MLLALRKTLGVESGQLSKMSKRSVIRESRGLRRLEGIHSTEGPLPREARGMVVPLHSPLGPFQQHCSSRLRKPLLSGRS